MNQPSVTFDDRILVLSLTKISDHFATGVYMRNLFSAYGKQQVRVLFSGAEGASAKGWERLQRCINPDGLRRKWNLWRNGTEILQSDWTYIEQFNPSVVYFRPTPEAPHLARLAMDVQSRLGARLVVHVMDDIFTPLEKSTASGDLAAAHTTRVLKRAVRSADVRLTISKPMALEFTHRFGSTWSPLENMIDECEWPRAKPEIAPSSADKPIRILYTGAIAPLQHSRTLRLVFEALEIVNRDRLRATLQIHTSKVWVKENPWLSETPSWVLVKRPIDRTKFPALLQSASILLTCINFDSESLTYVRHSIQNKAIEYMAAGRPILIVGPRESATVAYALDEKWATVVTQPDPQRIASRILDLMTWPEGGPETVHRAFELVWSRHTSLVLAARFRACIGGG